MPKATKRRLMGKGGGANGKTGRGVAVAAAKAWAANAGL
jgi:hypothetical protein